ncbi:MAG: MFS transporter [Marinoscillum sp.]|uniref:MFS transporter n=1 Tax=Marinoscillum sp. TaxID=2024838 RepID=UPI0032FA8440
MSYLHIVKKHPQILGYGALHYFFSAIGQTFLISVSVPYLLRDMGLTSLGFSNRYAIATISSALVLPLVGGWVDRARLSTLSVLGGLGLITACLFMFFSARYALLLPALFLMRFFGQGSMVLIGSTAIAKFFTKNRGKGLSLASMGLSLAETFMPLIFVGLIGLYSWENAWLIMGAGVLLVFIPGAYLLIRNHLPGQEESGAINNSTPVNDFTRRQVLKDPHFYLTVPVIIFLPFFITGIFIHQNLIAQAKGWTLDWMAFTFIGYGVSKVVTSFLGGSLIDRFTARKVFVFYLLPLAVGLIFLAIGEHKVFALVYMILLGMTASLSSLTGVAIWAEMYGPKNLGAIKSMVTTIMVVSTALGPIVLGWALEQSLQVTLYTFSAIILVLILLSYLVVNRKSP